MSPGSESPPPAYGVNLRVLLGLESHFEPVRYEWLYRIAPKIIETLQPYHDSMREQATGMKIMVNRLAPKLYSTKLPDLGVVRVDPRDYTPGIFFFFGGTRKIIK